MCMSVHESGTRTFTSAVREAHKDLLAAIALGFAAAATDTARLHGAKALLASFSALCPVTALLYAYLSSNQDE